MKKTERSLEWAIENRMTIRELTGEQLSAEHLQRLVRAAYGITHKDGRTRMRTAPSAGATYPIELYMVVERVDKFVNGIYRYSTKTEKPVLAKKGGFLSSIGKVSLDQDFIPLSNIVFIMIYNPRKIVNRYGRDSRKYASLECGHIAQNILLTASALGLGSIPVGAFSQKRLGALMGIPKDREVLYMICIGAIDS